MECTCYTATDEVTTPGGYDAGMSEPFYVTTPIYYVNDKPHLGHVYTTMIADVVARYHRLRGDDVFFLTGVDEHAAKVADKAAENNLSPQQWADRNAAAFREVFEKLEMTNDDFVRTSEDRHKQKVTEYVAALLKSGDVYQGEYEGWYDAGQEEYVPENKAKASEYKSEVNGKPLVRKSEKNYFFKLEKYRDQVIRAIEGGEMVVKPDARRNEIINRLAEAKDVPISRSGSGGWGIPMPNDPKQTIYVWIDALFNYLSYIDTPERKPYWQSGATHFIAKDILWFHASIWPAMLMALRKCPGYEWVNLPRMIYSHSYWVSETGQKMSKSLGNFLDPQAIDNYVKEFGLDALRYFLATRGPLGTTDSAFSPDLFAEVYNSDLANTFGNSCSRVTNMIGKYFEGKVPESPGDNWMPGKSQRFSDVLRAYGNLYKEDNASLNLSSSAHRGLEIVRLVDSTIDIEAPFKLAKEPANLPRVGNILCNCLESLRIASILLWPFIPDACELFWERIGCDYAAQMKASDGKGKLDEWVKWGQLKPGQRVETGTALFPRYQVK
ncbi:MAG: methionine--tRNA ligase [Phycisphaeraceae bacterium]|nr:methionine--tRNA ligase [Phycisphaeraceae bacterium]